jgi:hypothetical protein
MIRSITTTASASFLCLIPQKPSGSYQACKGLASIPEGPANDILSVSSQQGTNPGLLAVTWGHESGFSYNPPPNPRWNEDRTRIIGYDVGPIQVANTLWNKSPFTDGLPNAFGIDIGAAQFGHRSPFNGNAFNNLSVGAGALNDGM